MSGDKKYFVNRHGKKSGISGAVDQIESTEPKQSRGDDTRPKKQRKKITMPTIKVSKKAVVIIVISLAVAVSALVIVADSARRSLERDASRMQTSIREAASRTVSPETSASDAAEGLLTQLDADTSCSSGLADIVRSVYSPARNAHEVCRERAVQYETIRDNLTELKVLSEYLESQNSALSSAVALPNDGSFAEIGAQVAAWTAANDALQKLSSPDVTREIHAETLQNVRSITENWARLQTANADQDRAAFTQAETDLSIGYETLRASGVKLDVLINELQKSIDTSVLQLLNTEQ